MPKIQVFTLQTPLVLLDGNPVVFPYKKTEALFYYLAAEKSVTRDVISYLLWEDANTETAHKNLRHALYMIKKVFGFEVITSSQKFNLSLHPDIVLHCDVDELMDQGNMNVYESDFLSNFFVKNSDAFDEWMEQKRENIKSYYLIKLYDYIHSLSYDNLSKIELSCLAYMKADPFDERVVYALIKAYHANKLYLKGIKAYQKLHKELGEELGIVPGQEITDLYRKLRMEWADSSAVEEGAESFVVRARKKETLLLKNTYRNFVNGRVQAVIVSGENGIGKTYLVQSLLESIKEDDTLILSTFCFSQEKNTLFYPWNSIMLQLDDYIQKQGLQIPPGYIQAVAQFFPTFGNQSSTDPTIPFDLANTLNLRAVQNGIFRILSQITEQVPVLLVFDNLHFADQSSRHLISSLLRDLHENFMVIFTSLEPLNTEMLEFVGGIQKEGLLTQIHLNRFTKEDMMEIISATLDRQQISPAILNKIFEETAGNAFFLTELLNTYKEQRKLSELSINAQSILAQRLIGLTTQAKQALDIISLFHDYASLDILEKIFGGNPMDTLNSLEELKTRALIKEKLLHNEIRFSFTHSKMREYVHSQIPPSKQKVLCNSIANALEQTLSPNSSAYYGKLIYYFTLGGNSVKTLMYQIYQFEDMSVTMFELYPSQLSEDNLQTPENLTQYFVEVEKKLNESRNLFFDFELFEELHARLLIAKGRYSILTGLYCEGLVSIKDALQLAYVKNHPSYMLRALRQMVYYGIQINHTELMHEYIQKGLTISKENYMWLEYALFLRLNGLLYMLLDDFTQCYSNLMESIAILENHSIQNSTCFINTSAAYNYLGEMERRQKHFDKALEYYHIAIDLCQKNNINMNATHYTNIGCAYYEKGEKEEAFRYFMIASDIYDNSFTLMGRSTAKGYCAIYYSEHNDFDKAKLFLNAAQKASNQLGSPIEKGILRKLQADLLTSYPDQFSDLLNEPLSFYLQDAKRLLP